jgi:hypothetical protein
MTIAGVIATQLLLGAAAQPQIPPLPRLVVAAAAITDDVVVTGDRTATAPIVPTPIRSRDVDLAKLTAGLISGGRREQPVAADTEQRIAVSTTRGNAGSLTPARSPRP